MVVLSDCILTFAIGQGSRGKNCFKFFSVERLMGFRFLRVLWGEQEGGCVERKWEMMWQRRKILQDLINFMGKLILQDWTYNAINFCNKSFVVI